MCLSGTAEVPCLSVYSTRASNPGASVERLCPPRTVLAESQAKPSIASISRAILGSRSWLSNYTMSAAFELANRGITANMVYPPVTDTGWVSDTVRQAVQQDTHLIHIAQPGDVANVIAYLASDHARLITGNVIHLR